MDYSDHTWMLAQLKAAQEADHDMREQAREADAFITHRQGQWETKWWDAADGRPRYTFDQVGPIIDQVAGTIERSEFAIDTAPAGGEASIETAETMSGLIRNINNLSRAEYLFNRAGRRVVKCGLAGWRATTKYVDGDSFDQDLVIEGIPNYVDRVWHGPHEEPDASDADYCWILTGMAPEVFKAKYPDADDASVGTDRQHNDYYHRDDLVMVGEFLYCELVDRELIMLSDGTVMDGEEFILLADELAEAGVTEVRRRKRKVKKIKSRKFSAHDWLEPATDTVFENWIPVVPCYGNFDVSNDKRVYHGIVEKLMDAQRVYNYAQSRQIEEGALAPRAKWLSTYEQREGHEDEWRDMNVSKEPWLTYNAVGDAPPPVFAGGPQINPGLQNITNDMRSMIGTTAGMFAANMGDNPGLQSGVAIDKLQDRGDTSTNKFMEALEFSMTQTARILVNAIPRVYTPGRQIRILDEDGSRDFVTIGQAVQDRQTGQMVIKNDLSSGTYDVVVTIAPSYKNRQNETVSALTEIGKVDPSVIQMGGDVLARNVSSPGMRDIAERKRRELFQAGLIPEKQWTDAERAEMEQIQAQQANQPPVEDPNMVLAKAEEQKAVADQMEVQRKMQEQQQKHEIEMRKLQLEEFGLQLKAKELEVGAAEAGVKIDMSRAKARKDNADAEAQEVQNYTVQTGLNRLLEAANAGA